MQRGCELSGKACKLLKELSCKGHCVSFHSCLSAVALFASSVILLPQQPTEMLYCVSDLRAWLLFFNIDITFSNSANHIKLLVRGGLVI